LETVFGSVKSGFVSREHSEQLSALYVKSGIEIKSVFRAVERTPRTALFLIYGVQIAQGGI
jgi:hypothetical protein